MSRVICVYVGSASQGNLRVGLEQGIWGFKTDRPDYDVIQPGDVVLLASGFSGGSPRKPLAEWRAGSVASIDIGVVSSERFHDDAPVWPDETSPDVSYPFRFRFQPRERVRSVPLGEAGPLGEAVAEGLRKSAIVQGSGQIVVDPEGFTLDVPSAHVDQPTFVPDQQKSTQDPVGSAEVADLVAGFERELSRAGLRLSDDLALRFLCGLLAKPFVICAGLSGSGKTQLAMALGEWIGPERRHVAAVRPDWTGAEALFGYENLLLPPAEDGRPAWTVPAELRFMLQAADDPAEPYLLILDEMNLAHVERYFADVLSGMESGAEVLPNLAVDDDGIWRPVPAGPARLPIPPNLLVVGTVNMDETTYQFSPKVLDRSTTLEFRVSTESLTAGRPSLDRISQASPEERRLLAERPVGDLIVDLDVDAEVRKGVESLHRLLAANGREFGHRTYQEMLRFAELVQQARPEISSDTILDYLVAQKVLPRVHGSSRELSGVMDALAAFLEGRSSGDGCPISTSKLARMRRELDATHFTAF